MQFASKLNIELTEGARIFNITDEILRGTPVDPQFASHFQMLNQLVVTGVLSQPLNSYKFKGPGNHFIHGLGATICSYNALSVYHFIRMNKDDMFDPELRMLNMKQAADNFYHEHEFRTGVLPKSEDQMRFIAFHPRGPSGYRVEHLIQVLDKNVTGAQVCHLEITTTTKVAKHA